MSRVYIQAHLGRGIWAEDYKRGGFYLDQLATLEAIDGNKTLLTLSAHGGGQSMMHPKQCTLKMPIEDAEDLFMQFHAGDKAKVDLLESTWSANDQREYIALQAREKAAKEAAKPKSGLRSMFSGG